MSQIYGYLGGSPQCGRCAHTIKRIMEKITAPLLLHTIPQQHERLLRALVAKSAAGLLGGG
jgi:hypothetical protein